MARLYRAFACDSCVSPKVVWRSARRSRTITCDSCVSPVYQTLRDADDDSELLRED
ncbi:hypothetical protein [Nostoc sp. LPT]|uniref:hypothetical protein n=1 Tax=Nostoc sp. LPT TaxID=2815387 RepID=UPI001DB90F45|nr:hypothetical protein [Nostoc sp. LPT]MBN4002420.1 hypothetical protein [Nostoc sp. LPT]